MAEAVASAGQKTAAPAVVVTGGSAGIGLAIAKRFLTAGHNVVLIARGGKALDRAVQELPPALKRHCHTLCCDVTDSGACDRIEDVLAENGLYLDILINNAAIGLSGPFAQQSAADVERLVATNIAALTRLTRRTLPAMIARGRGGIINIASLGGYVPGPNQAAYYASKAYTISLSEALASEVSGTGVTVCCVAPGPVRTGFHAAMGAAHARYRHLLPDVSPERVASSTYRGWKLGQRVIIPGILPRLTFLILRLTPHPLSVPITRWLLENPRPN